MTALTPAKLKTIRLLAFDYDGVFTTVPSSLIPMARCFAKDTPKMDLPSNGP